MKHDETSIKLPNTISPQENYFNLSLLKQRINSLETDMVTIKDTHSTKADLALLKKDVEQINSTVMEIKTALEPLKDSRLVNKLMFAVIGLILMGFAHTVGQSVLKYLSHP